MLLWLLPALAGATASLIALHLSSNYLMAFCAPFTAIFAVWSLARHGRLADIGRWTGVVADPVASAGAYVGAPFTPLDPRPEAQRFVAAYRARFRAEPDGNAALAYDSVRLLAAAVRAVGGDRLAIRDWLSARTLAQPYVGVTGVIAFQADGDPIGKSFIITRVSSGRLALAESGR